MIEGFYTKPAITLFQKKSSQVPQDSKRPAIIPSISSAGVRTDMLDVHIDHMSLPVLWEKSYLCPCRNRATQQPNQSCVRCHGRGIAFLPVKQLNMVIQSQDKGIVNGDLGLMDSGTAIGTPDRSERIAFRDRVTVPNALVSQSFIFDVSQRRIDQGFYMVYDVHEIEFATALYKELNEDTDYRFDSENNLFFPNQSLLGQNVSINILTTLRYMVADLLKEHRYTKDQQGNLISLPQKLLLKREDIFIDKEAFEIGSDNADVGAMVDPKRPPNIDGLNGFFRDGKLH
jgi:hypothetical protein